MHCLQPSLFSDLRSTVFNTLERNRQPEQTRQPKTKGYPEVHTSCLQDESIRGTHVELKGSVKQVGKQEHLDPGRKPSPHMHKSPYLSISAKLIASSIPGIEFARSENMPPPRPSICKSSVSTVGSTSCKQERLSAENQPLGWFGLFIILPFPDLRIFQHDKQGPFKERGEVAKTRA